MPLRNGDSRFFLLVVLFSMGLLFLPANLLAGSGKLSCTPSTLWFGKVVVGRTTTLAATLTNSGAGPVTISRMNKTSGPFLVTDLKLPLTIAPGQSVRFSVTFAPQVNQHLEGQIAFTTTAPTPVHYIHLGGTGVKSNWLTAYPSSLGFGTIQAGSGKSQYQTLTNGGTSAVTITKAELSNAGFHLHGLNLPAKLNRGQSITYTVSFDPKSNGMNYGRIRLTSNAPNPILDVPFSGNSTSPGTLTLGPAALKFGSVRVGTSKNLSAVITASGAPVIISSATSTSPEFSLSGVSFPLTVAPGRGVPVAVKFMPRASGATTASIAFWTDAKTPAALAAGGTGAPASQHRVQLSWSAKPSALLAGYHVYRSGSSGGPYSQLDSSVVPTPSYIDDSVQSGRTYYYVTTTVNENGKESVHSNAVPARIP